MVEIEEIFDRSHINLPAKTDYVDRADEFFEDPEMKMCSDIVNKTYNNLMDEGFIFLLSNESQLGRYNDLVNNEFMYMEDFIKSVSDFERVHALLEKHDLLKSGKKILQLACNYDPYLEYLKTNYRCNVMGADTNSAASFFAQENEIDVRNSDARNLDFINEGEFDVVICSNFLDPDYLNKFMYEYDKKFADEINKMIELHSGDLDSSFAEYKRKKEVRTHKFIADVVAESYRILKKSGLLVIDSYLSEKDMNPVSDILEKSNFSKIIKYNEKENETVYLCALSK